MKPSFKTFVALLCVSIFLVQVYFGVAQAVEVFKPSNMVKSLRLESSETRQVSNTFSAGDTLRILANSDIASVYEVAIYRNGSLIFKSQGQFKALTGVADVFLDPPAFVVGARYLVIFNSYSYNVPIFGVTYQDSQYSAFQIIETNTQLAVNVTYEGDAHFLQLYANLTSSDGFPVVNETVGFEAKFFDRGRSTDGWTPLGSSSTNTSGIAEYDSAFCVPAGNYSFMAYHNATNNFGSSSDSRRIEITSNGSSSVQQASFKLGSSTEQSVTEDSHGTFSFDTNYVPTALMPSHFTVRYNTSVLFDPMEQPWFFFFQNTVDSHCIYRDKLDTIPPPLLIPGGYEYVGKLDWLPNCTGQNRIIVAIANGTMDEILNEINENAYFDEGSQEINISPCPSNLVVYSTTNSYQQQVQFTVAVCKPRTYHAQSTNFSASSTLAPHIPYGGSDYVVDDPVCNCPFSFYLNGTHYYYDTSQNGVRVFTLSLVFAGSDHLAFNITVIAPELGMFSVLNEARVQRIVSFTKVHVNNLKSTADGFLSFNSTVVGCGENNSGYYVGIANSANVKANLPGAPLWNASVQFIVADVSDRVNTTTGKLVNPWVCNYLRVFSINDGLKRYNFTVKFDNGLELLLDSQDCIGIPSGVHNVTLRNAVDVNGDWRINVLDLINVSAHMGWSGPAGSVPQDVNRDGKVNVLDLIAVGNSICSAIEATVEFSTVEQNVTLCTDNLGCVHDSWTPDYSGCYLVQTKLPSNCSATIANYTGAVSVKVAANNVGYFKVLERPVDFTLSLEGNYSSSAVTIAVEAYDPIIQKPVCNSYVEVLSHDADPGGGTAFWNGDTNASGIAAWNWAYPCHMIYGFAALFYGNQTYDDTRTNSSLDVRYPANITSLETSPVNFNVGGIHSFGFNLSCPVTHSALTNKTVHFYLNGTYVNGTQCSSSGSGLTNSSGDTSFAWAAGNNGTFSIRAVFLGDSGYEPCNCSIIAMATVKPFALLFSVSETEFAPGASLTLNATIIDLSTNQRYTGGDSITVEFNRTSGGNSVPVGNVATRNGVALLNVTYPDNGLAYAYSAKIVPAVGAQIPQGLACNPMQLTVSKATKLLLTVSKDASSVNHLVKGQLLYGSSSVGNKNVTLNVNGTVYPFKTDGNGCFSKSLDLEPRNNLQTLYVLSASFGGDQPVNATAWAWTLDGTKFAACTTVQYGYKPATNSTTLTVIPQSTDTTTVTKTSEQLQKQAQQSGWLSTYNEFSWWYPWYRLHFVGKYNGQTMIDVGVAALPFADTANFPDTTLKARINEWLGKIAFNVFIGLVATEGTLWAASNWGLLGFGVVLAGYLAYKIASLFSGWGSVESLYISLVSSFVSTAYAVWTGLCNFLPSSLQALAAGAESIKSAAFASLCKLVMVPINIVLLLMTWNRIVELGGA